MCATCHVNAFTVTDEATGDFVFSATGHLFTAIPCVNEQGIPTTGDCGLNATERSFNGCTSAGCHSSEEGAALALQERSTRIQAKANELLGLLVQVDPNMDDAGGEIDAADPNFTAAEGAFFNYNLATFGDDVVGASTHNPYLVEALLIASIRTVTDTYGLDGTSAAELDAELEAVLERIPVVNPITRR